MTEHTNPAGIVPALQIRSFVRIAETESTRAATVFVLPDHHEEPCQELIDALSDLPESQFWEGTDSGIVLCRPLEPGEAEGEGFSEDDYLDSAQNLSPGDCIAFSGGVAVGFCKTDSIAEFYEWLRK